MPYATVIALLGDKADRALELVEQEWSALYVAAVLEVPKSWIMPLVKYERERKAQGFS